MAKTKVSKSLAQAFASATFPADEAGRRLAASLGDNMYFGCPELVAFLEVGAALRAESPERAQAATLAFAREHAPWEQVVATEGKPLWPIAHLNPRPGRSSVVDAGIRELVAVGRVALRDDRAPPHATADLLAWCEYGDNDALARMRKYVRPPFMCVSIDTYGPIGERLYQLLVAGVGDDDLAWLGERGLGNYGVFELGARLAARREGRGPLSSGLDCDRGARSDLHPEELRPYVELLAARGAMSRLAELVPRLPPVFFPRELVAELFAPYPELVARVPGAKSSKSSKSGKPAKASAKQPASKLHRALYEAANVNCRPDVRRLLAEGAKPDGYVDKDGWTGLHRGRGSDPEVVRLLAAAGADLDRGTSAGVTLLDVIASDLPSYPQLASARELLARGARGGKTHSMSPLHHAARRGNAELVELLLAHGADRDQRATGSEYAGMTALEIARSVRAHAAAAVLASHDGDDAAAKPPAARGAKGAVTSKQRGGRAR